MKKIFVLLAGLMLAFGMLSVPAHADSHNVGTTPPGHAPKPDNPDHNDEIPGCEPSGNTPKKCDDSTDPVDPVTPTPTPDPETDDRVRVYAVLYSQDKCGTENDYITRLGTSTKWNGIVNESGVSATFTVTDAEKYYFVDDEGNEVATATYFGTFTDEPCKVVPPVDKPEKPEPPVVDKPVDTPDKDVPTYTDPRDGKEYKLAPVPQDQPVKATAYLPNTGAKENGAGIAIAGLLIMLGSMLMRRKA